MDHFYEALDRIKAECEKLGFQPSYLSSEDPTWEPDYLVLEPGFSLCIDPLEEIGWVSYWSREHGRYYIGSSAPLARTDWIMNKVNDAMRAIRELEKPAA